MRKTIFTLLVTMMALTFSLEGFSIDQDPAKKEIKVEELPMEVRTAVSDSEYATWTLVKIHEVTGKEEGTKDYEILVKDDTGSALTLVYNKEGKLLETKE
ncbi:hypothetical protein FNH22_28380 [Fulvivirga sp. M361]|uniref:hypothetical protein n=1 Tax=Fulvivirga sp. M361 TaxID=2594266 RepID=UPI00117B4D2D|nr:hypothetical protein [Fulvivirga sp. M361]TRX48806.1 hypothetical protein FNH22_28380 [Fulvivirga sp. M361]